MRRPTSRSPTRTPSSSPTARRSGTSPLRDGPTRARSGAACDASAFPSARSSRASTAARSRPRGSRSGARPSTRRSSTRSPPSTTRAWRTQIRNARRLLGTRPAPGKLTVLVTHNVVVQETTGQTLEEGEAIVFRPLGSSRFRVVGRVLPREWGMLRQPGLDRGDRPARPGVPGPRGHASARRGGRSRRDGLVHGPAHRQAGPARPEDGTDDGDPARGRLGAARRHRRARRRRVGDRRRAQRDRPGRPRHVGRSAAIACPPRRATRTSTPRRSTTAGSSGSPGRAGSTGA